MNFYQIVKNNFLQFRLIFLSISGVLTLLIYLSYNSYVNNNTLIKKVEIKLYGNFSHIIFNRLNHPIFQKYENNKVYLLSNKTINDFVRVYNVFYLYNIENQRFFDKWKYDLEKSFESQKKYRYRKNYLRLDLPEKFDSAKLNKLSKDINSSIEELNRQIIIYKNLGDKDKLENIDRDRHFYLNQKSLIEETLNSKIVIVEDEKIILDSKNKYSFVVELFLLLVFYFFANLYLSTFLKKIK